MATEFKTSYVIRRSDEVLAGQKLSVAFEMARPVYSDQREDGTVSVREGHESEYVVIRRNGRDLRFGVAEAEVILEMLVRLSVARESSMPE